MAQGITISIELDFKKAEAQAQEFARKIKSALDAPTAQVNAMRNATDGLRSALTALSSVGAVALFERIGRSALDAAISIDRQVSSLRALTGSAEAAQRRFQELFRIAQATPGLTTSLATTLDTQLRVFNVSTATINKLLPVVGRLNAISPLGDPRQFVNNLTQLISQNFERQDLKELVGQSPIAGKLLAQIFNVDNPTNAEAIRAAAKKMGVTTVERLADELIKAGESNPALKNAVETLGGQFEKLKDRLEVALAPIGDQIAKTILPLFGDLAKEAERVAPLVAQAFKDNEIPIRAMADALGAVAKAMGGLAEKLGALDTKIGLVRNTLRGYIASLGLLSPQLAALLGLNFERSLLAQDDAAAREAAALAGSPFLTSSDPAGVSPFLSSPVRKVLEEKSNAGGGGISGTTGRASVSRAAKERAREIAEATRDLARGRQELFDTTLEDIERISKTINEANLDADKRRKADAEFLSKRLIEQREARQRLTAQDAENFLRLSRRELTRSGRFIEDAISRGQLTGGEAELLRQSAAGGFANQLREALARQQDRGAAQSVIDDLRDEIELFDRLSVSVSNSERFMRGFNSQIESIGDAFDRFGANVARAFTNVRDLFNSLKQAVLGFFNDLLGTALQNLVKNTLGGLFGNLGGSLGNLFRTPTFAGGFGGGGISAPPSVSLGPFGFGQGFGIDVSSAGAGFRQQATGIFANGQFAAGLAGASKFSFANLGKSFASAAPFLGLSLGGSLGGQSIAGNILGSAGGFLAGGAVAGAAGLLGPAATAFFTNPFTAIAGVGLLVGGLLLGKAKQRKSDEEASGEFLRQALAAIDQLASGVASGSIDGNQARAIFENQILGQFIQQIRTLKTRSVVESRLTNQVADLRNVFEARIPPLIAQQEEQRRKAAAAAAIDSRLVPEFATGGTTRGGLAFLHPGEKVVNLQQQATMRAMAGPNIFERAGVPGPSQNRIFDIGGTMSSGSMSDGPIVIEELTIAMDAEGIVVRAMSGPRGRAVTVKNLKLAQLNREV